ncbi:hypothetical protein B296_00007612 [Ensete ventricosum]|uniref:Uncharacterized protein n=1 Tax=Ensete ventricosum TaxID=4639 RepID=A0A427AJ11_ENSVE|nr:hypothetical protein B296_00007612 [Ensete ventricosum]
MPYAPLPIGMIGGRYLDVISNRFPKMSYCKYRPPWVSATGNSFTGAPSMYRDRTRAGKTTHTTKGSEREITGRNGIGDLDLGPIRWVSEAFIRRRGREAAGRRRRGMLLTKKDSPDARKGQRKGEESQPW